MPLNVILVSGPRGGGKTTLVELLGQEVLDHRPHHIRLVLNRHPGPPHPALSAPAPGGSASSRALVFDPATVMDELANALRDVRRQERYATVLVEGDDVPSVRNALPYDCHVFVMPAPASVHDVFRRPAEAEAALRQVMQDTEAFAAEMFGLFLDETRAQSPDAYAPEEQQRRSERALDSADVRSYLRTPAGVAIASRIQLQPAYQGLAESDVILVNSAVGAETAAVDDCVHKIETLLGRIRDDGDLTSALFCCDPLDRLDPIRPKLFRRLAAICAETE